MRGTSNHGHAHNPFSTRNMGRKTCFHGALAMLPNYTTLLCASFLVFFLIVPPVAVAQNLSIISDPHPPFGYVKDGEIVGFTVDVIRLLLEKTGLTGKFVMYPWARAYKMAQQEKDILIYTLSYTKERERLFQLVGPIVHGTDDLWKLKARKDVVVGNLEDVKRYQVGVVRDYYTYKYLIENGFKEGKNLDVVSDDNMNVKKLASGRIDLMFVDEIVFNYLVREGGYNRDDFEKALSVISHDAYIGFSRQTSGDVVSRFARTLEAIKTDGSYDAIRARYGVLPPTRKQD